MHWGDTPVSHTHRHRDTRSRACPPQAQRRDDERRRLQYGDCQCAQSEVDYSLQHIGAANISWPPGLGRWFSTPAKGECAEGAQLGTGGCAWRRLPQARIAYGFELVEAGFRRVDGPEVHGQTLVEHAQA